MSLTMPNLVPQRPFCYLNFISVAKPQKFGNETYVAHVLASSKAYRKHNKPKIGSQTRKDTCHFDKSVLVLENF